jgi:hypothetical protein
VINQGAGYLVAPVPIIALNPNDPATVAGTAVLPAATTALVASGSAGGAQTVSAVVCTNGGTAQTALPTLTFAGGGGSNAAATVIGCYTVTGITVTTAGATVPSTTVRIDTQLGLQTATATVLNPVTAGNALFNPRVANIYAPVSTGAVGTPVIIDGGLFQNAPTPVILAAASQTAITTTPTCTAAIGGISDTIFAQQIYSFN